MDGHVGAPISAVLQLEPTVAPALVAEALTEWLQKTHGVALESAEHENLVVEWRTSDDTPFACQLVASDSRDQARRTVTVVSDDAGVVAIVEESPLTAIDAPHAIVDLSETIRLLLSVLMPMTKGVLELKRDELNQLQAVDSGSLLAALQEDLMPGLLVAVTGEGTAPSTAQQSLLDDLLGLSIVGCVPVGASLLGDLGVSASPRAGSIMSIARTSAGLDAHVIASTSLRTKPDSARRLVVRRQLSAPVPFDLERRRSAAMRRLLASGHEIDLPTALQLLDEESQRANEFNNRVKGLETQLEQAFEEQDTALGDLDDALSRLRYLDRAFRDLGEVPTVEAEFDDDWRPDSSVEALVAAQELLPFLVISATENTCNALDGQQKRGIWAKKIWLSLRALNDYCRAKAEGRFSGDIAMYRDNTPDGAIPLLADYASTESQSTNNDAYLKAMRTFTVPTAVDPAGRAYMEQHLKIDKGGQSAPRMHLHDDSGGSTQRIYIGYIGPHLPTSSGF